MNSDYIKYVPNKILHLFDVKLYLRIIILGKQKFFYLKLKTYYDALQFTVQNTNSYINNYIW